MTSKRILVLALALAVVGVGAVALAPTASAGYAECYQDPVGPFCEGSADGWCYKAGLGARGGTGAEIRRC